MLSRQPKVTTSTPMHAAQAARGETSAGVEHALVLQLDRAGHQHVVVALAPVDRRGRRRAG